MARKIGRQARRQEKFKRRNTGAYLILTEAKNARGPHKLKTAYKRNKDWLSQVRDD